PTSPCQPWSHHWGSGGGSQSPASDPLPWGARTQPLTRFPAWAPELSCSLSQCAGGGDSPAPAEPAGGRSPGSGSSPAAGGGSGGLWTGRGRVQVWAKLLRHDRGRVHWVHLHRLRAGAGPVRRRIAAEPLRLLFLIAGGFFWLVSLLLSSLVWFIAVQIGGSNNASVKKNLLIFGVVLSVLLQEVFRFAYYKLLKKANKGLMTISQEETMPISVRQLSYVSGLGFGIMSGVFSLVNILTDSLGPGTVGIYGDSPQYFLSSAFMTLAIVLLHIFWGIVFFDACEKKKWWALALVILSHLLVSGLTFLNPQYEGNLVPSYVIMMLMGTWAFFTAGGSLRNLKLCLMCRDKDFLLANQRPR
uniref:Gamma-secretase subunit APH-1 n=1 Tax=Chelydra serpentina TaxID=8475 RepID=A0A8C3TGT3_CHESE